MVKYSDPSALRTYSRLRTSGKYVNNWDLSEMCAIVGIAGLGLKLVGVPHPGTSLEKEPLS